MQVALMNLINASKNGKSALYIKLVRDILIPLHRLCQGDIIIKLSAQGDLRA